MKEGSLQIFSLITGSTGYIILLVNRVITLQDRKCRHSSFIVSTDINFKNNIYKIPWLGLKTSISWQTSNLKKNINTVLCKGTFLIRLQICHIQYRAINVATLTEYGWRLLAIWISHNIILYVYYNIDPFNHTCFLHRYYSVSMCQCMYSSVCSLQQRK